MKYNINILHLCPDLKLSCGRTKYVYNLSNSLINKNIKIFIGTNKIPDENLIFNKNIVFFILPISPTNRNIFNFFIAIRKLRNIIIENQIDLIHTHHRYPELISFICKKYYKLNINLITSVNSIARYKIPFEYKSDILIAVSNYVKEYLESYHKINSKRIIVLYNYVENYMFNFVTKINEQNDTFKLLAVGRFHKDKNFLTLIKAMKLLNNKNIHLWLIGEGKEQNVYKDYITANNLNIKILEPTNNLSIYYNSCDVCILPSKIEPMSYFIMEAGMFAKPVIVSNTGGNKEIVNNNIDGILFKTENEFDLAEKISLVYYNKDNYNYLGYNLKTKLKEYYNEKNHMSVILDLYNKLIF